MLFRTFKLLTHATIVFRTNFCDECDKECDEYICNLNFDDGTKIQK
jgi:hypothetical protein